MRESKAISAALLALALALSALQSPAQTQEEAPDDTVKCIAAIKCNCGIKIDGIIDEPIWDSAPRSGGFIQYQPDHGKPASESTFVRVAYDDEALFVAMEMYDSEPDKIISRLTRRDRWVEGDLVNVIVDSYHDHQTAYAFTLFASGTQRDVYYYNDTWSDSDWDAVWEGRTRITDWGWSAEFKIPFHCLRFSCKDNPVWGIYFSRSMSRKNELDRWLDIPESAPGFVSCFGHLQGLQGLTSPNRFEVRPYAVSYAERLESSLANPDGRDYSGTAGFDLKYGINSNLTLDATVNPDFGQVEADETVLNLSTFETWYPEKRPFFLEGSKIFDTYYTLFYSRRIGRPPSIEPDGVDYYLDRPSATTILAAAKVTGKTPGGTSLGFLGSATQRETAKFMDTLGIEQSAVIEPRASYFVGRIKQDVLRNSEIGLMATAVNQRGFDAHYAGGADWNLRFRDGNYKFGGQMVGSRTGAGERGWAGVLMLEKSGGDHLHGSLRSEYRSREIEINRIGYLDRADYQETFAWVQYRTTGTWWKVKKSWHNLNLGYSDNLDNVALVRGGNYNNSFELTNYWSLGGGSWQDYDKTYSDRETRGGPPAPIPIGRNWWLWFDSDPRKPLMVSANVGGGDTWDGHYKELTLWFEIRPWSNIEFNLSPRFRESWGVSRWLKYLEDDEGNRTDDIFGEQNLERFDLTLRGTISFTRDLTLQVYAQPYMASVDYENFKKLVPPDGYEPVDASVYDESTEEPDFNWSSFNSNVVLRWEYRPGSTLFLVWTQARDETTGYGNFELDRDWKTLFRSAAVNTFLVKVNYWWAM